MLGVLTPSQPCFPKIAVLEAQEELVSRLDCSVIQVLLASCSTDPLEDLLPERLPGNRSNRIDCILLTAHIGDPLQEDVLKLGHVNIASFAALERGKGRLEVLLDLVTVLRGCVQGLGQGLDLGSLLPTSFIASVNQVSPLVHFLLVLRVQLTLNRIVMLISPCTECLLELVFHPVDEHFPHSSFLLVRLPRILQPSVETTSKLHLRHAAHVVRHDFLREIL